jgi:hypothetical protein
VHGRFLLSLVLTKFFNFAAEENLVSIVFSFQPIWHRDLPFLLVSIVSVEVLGDETLFN